MAMKAQIIKPIYDEFAQDNDSMAKSSVQGQMCHVLCWMDTNEALKTPTTITFVICGIRRTTAYSTLYNNITDMVFLACK